MRLPHFGLQPSFAKTDLYPSRHQPNRHRESMMSKTSEDAAISFNLGTSRLKPVFIRREIAALRPAASVRNDGSISFATPPRPSSRVDDVDDIRRRGDLLQPGNQPTENSLHASGDCRTAAFVRNDGPISFATPPRPSARIPNYPQQTSPNACRTAAASHQDRRCAPRFLRGCQRPHPDAAPPR